MNKFKLGALFAIVAVIGIAVASQMGNVQRADAACDPHVAGTVCHVVGPRDCFGFHQAFNGNDCVPRFANPLPAPQACYPPAQLVPMSTVVNSVNPYVPAGTLLAPGTIFPNGYVVPGAPFYGSVPFGVVAQENGFVTTTSFACVPPAPTYVQVPAVVAQPTPQSPQVVVVQAPAPTPVPQVIQPVVVRPFTITPPNTGDGGLLN